MFSLGHRRNKTPFQVHPLNSAKILVLGPWPVYEDLSMRHDWPVKNAIINLQIRMKGNLKRTSSNSLNPSGAQNRDLGAASQMLLTKLRLNYVCDAGYKFSSIKYT